jgi:hypothetical protein
MHGQQMSLQYFLAELSFELFFFRMVLDCWLVLGGVLEYFFLIKKKCLGDGI